MTEGVTYDFIRRVALDIGADPRAVYAVCKAECGAKPFFPAGKTSPKLKIDIGGKPKILFEPHVWWNRLIAGGLSPTALSKAHPIGDILYKKWGAHKYGTEAEQYDRLQRAMDIDRDSAVESVSYGAFQVMGYHWKTLGYASPIAFYERMMGGGIEAHAEAFIKYCQVNDLVKYLKAEQIDFARFAKGYNGPGYTKNKYDVRMAEYFKEAEAKGV